MGFRAGDVFKSAAKSCGMALQGAMGRRAESGFNPYAMSGTAARWSLDGAAGDSTFRVDSSNRIMLVADRSGNSAVNGLVLNGSAGNYASTPDSAAISITGDIDIRAYIAPATWVPAVISCIASKWGAAGQRAWYLAIDTAGKLFLSVTTDGSTASTATSSVATGFAAFSANWVRVTRASASGNVNFYTSSDGTTWSALGTQQTTTAGAIFNDTTALQVGEVISLFTFTGQIFRAQIYNGIAGTLAFDANFTAQAKLASSFTESSSNAATITINTSGDTGARISGARDWYQGTQSKQAIYLPWTGTNYGWLNGTSGNYFSTPDSAAVSITGSIDLRVQISAPNWANLANGVLIYKDAVGARSYGFYGDGTGNLVFFYTSDGTTVRAATSTASTSTVLTNNVAYWLRVTYNSATGATIFYTSTDGSTWTQLGATVTITSGAIFDNSSVLSIGAANTGTSPITGSIYRAQVYNGIAGTLAFDFNPATYTSGTTFTDSSSNAATITINGGAVVVQAPTGYCDGSDDFLKAAPFSLSQPESVYFVGSQVGWASGKTIFDGNADNSMRLLQDNSGPTTPAIVMYSGGYGPASASGFVLKTRSVLACVFNGASSSMSINRATATTGNAGATAASGFTIGKIGADVIYSNITFSEVLVRSAADNTSTQVGISQFLLRKWRIAA